MWGSWSVYEGLTLAYAHTEVLGIPDRPILPEVLRPLLHACREELRLEIEYVSFTTPKAETRLIAPHTLVNTGMRWHVRAYCEKNKAFRDFVLSRFRGQVDVLGESEFSSTDDLGWNAKVDIIIEPDRRLNAAQQEIIRHDFGMKNGRLVITSRGALVKYVLQQYLLDPNNVRAKASVQQISVANLDDLSVWL
jgi:predicted DNA-binding transcriptional regulator YafY